MQIYNKFFTKLNKIKIGAWININFYKFNYYFLKILLVLFAHHLFQLYAYCEPYWLGRHSEWVAADLEKHLSLTEISTSKEDIVPWKKSSKDILNFGMKARQFWVRSKLKNDQTAFQELFVELQGSYFQFIDMYIVTKDGVIESKVLGGSGRTNVTYLHRSAFPVISAKLNPKEEKYLLLNVIHYGTINLPLKVYQSRDELYDSVIFETTKNFVFYSTQIIILVLNFLFFLTTKNQIFILFPLSQLFHRGLTLASLDGYFQKYLVSDFPWITTRAFLLSISIGLILTIELTKQILKTALTKTHQDMLNFFILANFINLICFTVYPTRHSILTNMILEVAFMSFATYYSYKAYKKSLFVAKYLIISFPVMNILTFLYSLRYNGLFPINNFSNNAIQIGSTVEILMLGATLADRYNSISIDYIKQRALSFEINQRNRVGGGLTTPVPSHHRTYRSVYGGL